jgi:hypothetical protein
VLGLSAGSWFGIDDARGFGLAYPLSRIRLYRLGSGENAWLAFRHCKDEYGIDWAGEEVPWYLNRRTLSQDRILWRFFYSNVES